jgi:hypothetical protein
MIVRWNTDISEHLGRLLGLGDLYHKEAQSFIQEFSSYELRRVV